MVGRFVFLVWIFISGSQGFAVHHGVVLQYHHISETMPDATSVSLKTFKQHMQALRQGKFHVWPLAKLVNHVLAGKTVPDKTVAITFDDGYQSILAAIPILKKNNYPFTIFVNCQEASGKKSIYLSWAQLSSLVNHRATIANHGMTHDHMIRMRPRESPNQWRQRLRIEMVSCQKEIVHKTGEKNSLFAYPYGESNQTVQRIIKELGWMAFGQHSGPIHKESDRTRLPRFAFNRSYADVKEFIIKASSLPLRINSSTPVPTIIEGGGLRPQFTIKLKRELNNFNCYASGYGKLPIKKKGVSVTIPSVGRSPVGRSRINCTAPAVKGRFFWKSWPFITKNKDGSWHQE